MHAGWAGERLPEGGDLRIGPVNLKRMSAGGKGLAPRLALEAIAYMTVLLPLQESKRFGTFM